jgi:hypothetical protein
MGLEPVTSRFTLSWAFVQSKLDLDDAQISSISDTARPDPELLGIPDSNACEWIAANGV